MTQVSMYAALMVYVMVEVIAHLLGYRIMFQCRIETRRSRWILALSILLLFHLGFAYQFSMYDSTAMAIFTMLLVPIFLVKEKKAKGFGLYFYILMAISSISVSITFLVFLFTGTDMRSIETNIYWNLLCGVVPVFILLLVEVYRRYQKEGPVKMILGRPQYILYNVGAVCIYLMLSSVQFMSRGSQIDVVTYTYGLVATIACNIFAVLLVWHGRVVSKQATLTEQIRERDFYNKLEEAHFKELLVQDEKLRRFRHDYRAHMSALRGYVRDNNMSEVEQYLEKMMETSYIQTCKYTGDAGVDAVLNELIERAKGENIPVECKGNFAVSDELTSFEWCSVLHNLVLNAIEANEKLAEEVGRKIVISILNYQGKTVIQIANATEKQAANEGDLLHTTKEDARNHGLGTKNVEDIIKRHNGVLKFHCENGAFTVEVIV